jgi:hypothetical protein
MELTRGQFSPLHEFKTGGLVLLGVLKGRPLVLRQEEVGQPVAIGTVQKGGFIELSRFAAVPSTVRYQASADAVSFSRNSANDVQNIFFKDLTTGAETAITSNGIQGIAFSPVAESGRGLFVFSQQLRNKDLGIIRLDSR